MRDAGPVTLVIVSLVAISVIIAGVASTLALARPRVQRLDADLASVIRADYSADPEGTRLAPLGEGIIEAARADKDSEFERLKEQKKREEERLEQEKKREEEPLPEQEPPPAPTPIPELQGVLFLDSGEDPSAPGGPPAAGEALWQLGERLLVRLENLDSQRFPGGESCETRIQVGPVVESVAIMNGVAELDIQNNVPVLVPGTRAEVRIRCEFQDEGGERQRQETRWRGTLESVTLPSGVSLESDFEIVIDPQYWLADSSSYRLKVVHEGI